MIKSSTGLKVENAYIKIDEYSCDRHNSVNVRVRAYVSKELEMQGAVYLEGSEDIFNTTILYDDYSPNPKKQIYEYLKTLDKYKEATDVIEPIGM